MQSAVRAAMRKASRAAEKDPDLSRCWQAWLSRLRAQIGASPTDHDFLAASAYTTLCRTIPKLRASTSDEQRLRLRHQSSLLLREQLDELVAGPKALDRGQFDAWHRQSCERLCRLWSGLSHLSVGQAQKWVNILVKYYAAHGAAGLFPELRRNFLDLLHSPVDSIVYAMLADADDVPYGEETLADWFAGVSLPPWSRIEEYDTYMSIQDALRRVADQNRIPPCTIELIAWKL